MNISEADLKAEFDRGWCEFPEAHRAAGKYGLPRRLIWAVASRETNIQNETGDGGHGHGIWQLDDRFHTIPHPFTVEEQANKAASQLADLIRLFPGNLPAAVAAYNAGVMGVRRAMLAHLPVDYYTTGRDYSADVLGRMDYLRRVDNPECRKAPAKKAVPAHKPPAKKATAKKAPAKRAGK